nr:DUF3288 [Cavernulicola chilensis]
MFFIQMSKKIIKFNRHYFPPWAIDEYLIMQFVKQRLNTMNTAEIARLYLRYSQIKEAYLVVAFLNFLLKNNRIPRKILFHYTQKIHANENLYFFVNSSVRKPIRAKPYKPIEKELRRRTKNQKLSINLDSYCKNAEKDKAVN